MSKGSKQVLVGHSDIGSTGLPSVENTGNVTSDSKKSKSVSVQEKMSENKKDFKTIFSEAKNTIARLHKSSDYTSEESQNYFKDIILATCHKDKGERKDVIAVYCDAGITLLFQNVWETIFPKKLDYEKKENSKFWIALKSPMIALWNGTDASPKMCQNVFDSGVYKYIVQVAMEIHGYAVTNVKTVYQIKALLGIIHNCLRFVDTAKPSFREVGAVELMNKWRKSGNTMVETKSEINLAYLINDDESNMIDSTNKTIPHLIGMLADALKEADHQSKKYGFNAEETLEALNKLAANDGNKEKIIHHGALPHYVKMMEKDFNQNEQLLAVNGLWTLAFSDKNKDIMKINVDCMKGLQEQYKNGKHEAVREGAEGAIWMIERKNEQKAKESDNISQDANNTPHVMISYNWGSKRTMLKVGDRLKAAGYKIWMDVENMRGSTLDAMAKAVEDSCVVLICFSMKYKESPNCRTEAEYAYKCQRLTIPLRLQSSYQADGWLGAILGTNLWYDFSTESKFEEAVSGLIAALGSYGKLVSAMTPAVLPQAPASKAVSMKPKDVTEWLEKNDLAHHSNKFSKYNGVMLVEMKKMKVAVPDFFYTSLKNELGLPFEDILKLTSALDGL